MTQKFVPSALGGLWHWGLRQQIITGHLPEVRTMIADAIDLLMVAIAAS
ncbi:MAG: hypothetical protein WBB28_12625 [Crinalium sp.]